MNPGYSPFNFSLTFGGFRQVNYNVDPIDS